MTRWFSAAVLGVAASLVVPTLASAQSLAEIAAREKERREAAGKKVKSYSEDDLRRSGGAASSFETSSDEAAPAEGAAAGDAAAPAEGAPAEGGGDESAAAVPKEKADEALKAEKKAFNDKLQRAQDDLNNTASEIDKIQKDLGNNGANYYSAARTEMLNRLDGLTKKYATQKEALEAIRDEGRRKYGS